MQGGARVTQERVEVADAAADGGLGTRARPVRRAPFECGKRGERGACCRRGTPFIRSDGEGELTVQAGRLGGLAQAVAQVSFCVTRVLGELEPASDRPSAGRAQEQFGALQLVDCDREAIGQGVGEIDARNVGIVRQSAAIGNERKQLREAVDEN